MEQLVDYSRQASMQSDAARNMSESSHVIVGCGGIGYWLGIMLALYGARRIMLVDGDKVDTSNLARIPCPVTWVGFNKAVTLRRLVRYLRPNCIVQVFTQYLLEDNMPVVLGNADVVWDCTDRAGTQVMLSKYASEHHMEYIKLGYEGYDIGTFRNVQDVWGADTAQTGYQTTRANAFSSSMAAALGAFSVMLGENKDIHLNIQALLQQGGVR